MATRLVLLVAAVVVPALGQYHQPAQQPEQPPQRQGTVNPQWQGTVDPSWSSAPASRPAADQIVFPHSQPLHIRQQCTAVSARVDLVSGVSDQISGAIFFYQECPDHPVMVTGRISGLSPGEHGLHVHEHPNLTDQCKGAGGHFNPLQSPHGAQTNDIKSRHVGDLGNIVVDYQGVAEVHIVDPIISLFPGDRDIFRRAVVVHSGRDDLGLGGNEASLKTGNAGMRLACGIIAPNNSPRC